MDFEKLIQTRQSCRDFDGRAVERELIVKCIEAGRLAPSAANAQPWRFVAVDHPELKRDVVKCLTGGVATFNRFVKEAGAFVVLAEEPSSLPIATVELMRNQDFAQVDMGIAAAHICLQAADLGLGSCILGFFSEKKLKKLLGVPDKLRIRLVIALGYSKGGEIRAKQRKGADEVASFNQF